MMHLSKLMQQNNEKKDYSMAKIDEESILEENISLHKKEKFPSSTLGYP